MEYAQYHVSFHRFLDPDPLAVARLYRGLGERLGLHAQLDKQAALGRLVAEFLRAGEGLQQSAQRELPHAVLCLLYALAGHPLRRPYLPPRPIPRDLPGGAPAASAEAREDDQVEKFGPSSSDSELSDWGESDSSSGGGTPPRGEEEEGRPPPEPSACGVVPRGFDLEVEAPGEAWARGAREARARAAAAGAGGLGADVSEAALVRQMLLMLQGLEGDCFELKDGKSPESFRRNSAAGFAGNAGAAGFGVRAGPGGAEPAAGSSRGSLLAGACAAASQFRDLRALAAGTEVAEAPPTAAAFALSLGGLLRDLARVPVEAETAFLNGGADQRSLLAVTDRLAAWTARVAALHAYVAFAWPAAGHGMSAPQAAAHVLSRLYALWEQEYALGNPDAESAAMVLELLRGAVQPCLADLDRWMTGGEAGGPGSEFFVAKDDSVGIRSSRYWAEGFTTAGAADGGPGGALPSFLAGLEREILASGKTVCLLNEGFKAAAGRPEQSLPEFFEAALRRLAGGGPAAPDGEPAGGPAPPPEEDRSELLPEFAELNTAGLAPRRTSAVDLDDEELLASLSTVYVTADRWGMPILSQCGHGPVGRRGKSEASGGAEVRRGPGLAAGALPAAAVATLLDAPPSVVMQRCLCDRLRSRHRALNRAVRDALLADWGLGRHLEVIAATFLMGSSEAMCGFADGLFAFIRAKPHWEDVGEINTILAECLGDSRVLDGFEDDLLAVRVGRREPRPDPAEEKDEDLAVAEQLSAVRFGVPHKVADLRRISLRYTVPWPLQMIIDEAALATYNAQFLFLLQVKYARHEMVRLQGSCFTARTLERKVRENVLQAEARGLRWPKVEHLRHRLFHFVSTVDHWLLDRLHGASLAALRDALRSASGFDGVLAVHRAFLADISYRALVGSEKLWASIAGRIRAILELAVQFAHACRIVLDADELGASAPSTTALVAKCNGELAQVDREFTDALQQLVTILSSSLRISGTPELAELALRLDYNSYAGAEAGRR